VRALLDLMRDNEAAGHDLSAQFRYLLREAVKNLKILDPDHVEEELLELVAAELAKHVQPLRKPSTLNPKT